MEKGKINRELKSHHNEIVDAISLYCKDKRLSEYMNHVNDSIFRYSEWSFILKKIFQDYEFQKDRYFPILVGVEMVLLAAYIKDDIIDETELRNEMPTLFKTHGPGIASLFSDYVFLRGISIITKEIEKDSFEKAYNVQKELLSGFRLSAKGQLMNQVNRVDEYTLSNALHIIDLKTNSLLRSIFSIPSIVYGDTDNDDVPKKFITHLGYAFQIHNDLTEFVGDRKEKELFEDFKNKQMNIVIAMYMDKKVSNKRFLEEVFTNSSNLEVHREKEIIDEFEKNSIFKEVYDLYLSHIEHTTAFIKKFKKESTREFFTHFISTFT